MPLGRAGSIPAQRTEKTAIRRFFCVNEVLLESSADFPLLADKTIAIIREAVGNSRKILFYRGKSPEVENVFSKI